MALTIEDFDNGKLDLTTVSDVTNADYVGDVVSRLGTVIPTLVKAIQQVGFYPTIIAWQPSTQYNDFQQLVEENGVTYRLVTAHTSSASFGDDIANWLLLESGGGGGDIQVVSDLDAAVDGFMRWGDSAANAPVALAGGGFQISSTGTGAGASQYQFAVVAGIQYWRSQKDTDPWTSWVDIPTLGDQYGLGFLNRTAISDLDAADKSSAGYFVIATVNGTKPAGLSDSIFPNATLITTFGNTIEPEGGAVDKAFSHQRIVGRDTENVLRSWTRFRDEQQVGPAWSSWKLEMDAGDYGLGGPVQTLSPSDANDILISGNYVANQGTPTLANYLIIAVNKLGNNTQFSGRYQLASLESGSDGALWFRSWNTTGSAWSAWAQISGGGGSYAEFGYLSKNSVTTENMDVLAAGVWAKIEKIGGTSMFDDNTGSNGVTGGTGSGTLLITNPGTYMVVVDISASLDAGLSDIKLSICKYNGTEPATLLPIRDSAVRSETATTAFQFYQVISRVTVDCALNDRLIAILSSNAATNPQIRSVTITASRLS